MRPSARTIPILLAGVMAACAPADAPPPAGDEPAGTAAEPRGIETVLFSIEGFEGPEAVKYDPDQDVYFVSNFGSDPSDDANDGFLSRVNAEDGSIETLRWAVGDDERPLQEPRGMAIAGDALWVADARGLHAFDRRSGAQLRFVDLTALEPGFLNDVAVGPDGSIYVTDTGTSALIRLGADEGVVVASGEALGSPNGVTLDPSTGQLILVPWAGGDSLRVWDPANGQLEILARTPGARFDGVEFLNGQLIVASQGDSALHRIDGPVGAPFQKVPGSPADIAVDTQRNRIAVPYIALNRVDVFPGPSGG